MSVHAYHRCWVHLVWSTCKRRKILPVETRKRVSRFLYQYAESRDILMKINYVNADHVHALIDLSPDKSIQDIVKLLKGSSSHWINKNRIIEEKFSWGRGYGAFSVSQSNTSIVVHYIENQKIHHLKKNFSDEFESFLSANNLDIRREETA